jgi:hypothetical protein
MPAPKKTDAELIQALDWLEQYGTPTEVAKAGLVKDESTLRHRVVQARLRNLKPTFRREEARIKTRERLGRMHIVIPDCQVKPGVRTDHLEWVGNYIAEKKPDVIVCIGDFADMPSLSSYDVGKLSAEGRRYNKDVDAARAGMQRLMAPIQAVKDYQPRLVFTQGNHEERANRYAELHPEMDGKVGANDLAFTDWGWEVHPFLEVVTVDGVEYSHYFTSGVKGNPVSSAAALLRERQGSATMGHVQYTDMAIHKKTQRIGLFCGICYLHNETYLSPQDNGTRRQIVVKHEVEDGKYDPMLVSLRFLEKSYS